jgi:hypothetical protein
LWDGIVNPARMKDGKLPAEQRIVFQNNGDATFAQLNWSTLGPQLAGAKSKEDMGKVIVGHREKVVRDIKSYTGELKALPEVKLPGGK